LAAPKKNLEIRIAVLAEIGESIPVFYAGIEEGICNLVCMRFEFRIGRVTTLEGKRNAIRLRNCELARDLGKGLRVCTDIHGLPPRFILASND